MKKLNFYVSDYDVLEFVYHLLGIMIISVLIYQALSNVEVTHTFRVYNKPKVDQPFMTKEQSEHGVVKLKPYYKVESQYIYNNI